MNEQAKAIVIANIEAYVDRIIASGMIPPEAREKTIAEFQKIAGVA